MIDPELTKVLGRRILASVVNLLLLGASSLAFIAAQAERFVITQRNAEGNPVWPRYSDEGLRLAELDETFNRAITVGDNFYVWHTPALFVSGLIITLISLVLWVLVPASVGWSLGHRLLGLKVVTMDGQDPPLDGYLRRYVVGLIDLFPFVIPGLLGWLTASRNEHSQRIGDLSGDTVVVDANAEIRMIDATAYANRASQMIDVDNAIADHQPAKVKSGFSPDQVVAEAEAAHASPWDAPAAESKKDELYIPTHIEAPELDVSEAEVPEVEAPDAQAPMAEAAEQTDAIDAAQSEVTWSQPVAEPAPVWEPEPQAEPELAHAMADASPSTPVEDPAATNPTAAASTNAATAGSVAAAAASSVPGDGAPTWSDDWQAWLFWDHVNQRWLRHVEDDDSWLPIN